MSGITSTQHYRPGLTQPAASPPDRKILFIVPYKNRDLDGLSLVGFILEKRYGFEVAYSNGYGIEQKILEHKPDAVVFDHLVWGFKVRQAMLARSLGIKVILLPTEGLHQHKEEALRIAGKLSKSTHLIDCHFAWGDFVRDAVIADNLSPAERIHTVGCPRFDFYSPGFRALVPDRESFLTGWGIKNPAAPVILWCTNSSYAARDQKKMLRRQVTKGGLPEKEIRAMLRDGLTQLKLHSDVVLELASRHPDWNFIIKVHPAEWINPYVELAKHRPNVFLAYNAPIRDFLFHCEVLLQRGCTTSTEAWVLGKPVLELAMGNYHKPVRQDLVAGNQVVHSIDEADRAVQNYLGGQAVAGELQTAREQFLERFYFKIDGKSSARCAELISRTVGPPHHPDSDHALMKSLAENAYKELVKAENRRFPNRIKDVFGIPRDTSLRVWRRLLNTEAQDNLGYFVSEVEITPDMVRKARKDFEFLPFLTERVETLMPERLAKPEIAHGRV